MPDKTATIWFAPVFGMIRAFNLPQNTLGGRDLVGAHNEQCVTHIKHRIMQQHFKQGVLLKESGGKVFQVFNQAVVGFCPVHTEIEAVFVALGGISKIAAIGAVRDNKHLQVLIQRILAVKALFTVTMYLIKGFTYGDTSFFKLNLYQR